MVGHWTLGMSEGGIAQFCGRPATAIIPNKLSHGSRSVAEGFLTLSVFVHSAIVDDAVGCR